MSEVTELDGVPEPVTPLVTVAEARTYLQVDEEGKPTSALLEQVILGLSLRVLQHTGKTYINVVAKDAESSRQFSFDPSDRFLLIDDCRDVSKVEATATANDDESWVEVGPELFVTEPLGQEIADRIRFLSASLLPAVGTGWSALGLHARSGTMGGENSPWPHQVRTELASRAAIRVTGRWGYGPTSETVPANVKLALLMWAQNIHKRDQAFFGEAAKVTAKIGMPDDVRELLDGEEGTVPTVMAI